MRRHKDRSSKIYFLRKKQAQKKTDQSTKDYRRRWIKIDWDKNVASLAGEKQKKLKQRCCITSNSRAEFRSLRNTGNILAGYVRSPETDDLKAENAGHLSLLRVVKRKINVIEMKHQIFLEISDVRLGRLTSSVDTIRNVADSSLEWTEMADSEGC